MDKVLVIGMGQLGNCIRDAYKSYLNNLDGANQAVLLDFASRTPKDESVIKLDITDKYDFLNTVSNKGYQFIVNCSAFTDVNDAENGDDITREKCMKLNRDCLQHVSEFCEKESCNLIHISTDYVFDGNTGLKREDSQEFNPKNVYGSSKRDGEEVIHRYMGVKGKYMIIRTSSLYSQYGKNFVLTMINKFNSNKDVNVVIDNISSPTNANDFAHMILNHILIPYANGLKEIDNGVWHFSNEGAISWYDFAQSILSCYKKYIRQTSSRVLATDTETMIATASKKGIIIPNRPFASVIAKDKFKKEGYEIKYWKDSLNEFFTSQLNVAKYGSK